MHIENHILRNAHTHKERILLEIGDCVNRFSLITSLQQVGDKPSLYNVPTTIRQKSSSVERNSDLLLEQNPQASLNRTTTLQGYR